MIRSWMIWCMVLLPLVGFAQGDGGGDDPDVPVDGGVGLLLAAGAGYALKKLKDKHDTHD